MAAGVEISYKLINYSRPSYIVKDRFGFVTRLKYTESPDAYNRNKVILQVLCKVPDMNDVHIDPATHVNPLDRMIMDMIVERLNIAKKRFNGNGWGFASPAVELGAEIYLDGEGCNYGTGYQSDILGFTIEPEEDTGPGKYKEEELKNQCDDFINSNDVHSQNRTYGRDYLCRLIRIVDNENVIGDLWTTIAGESVLIKATKDSTKASGIYIYRASGMRKTTVIPAVNLTIAMLSEWGLCKSRLDLEQGPHGKVFASLRKKITELTDKVKSLISDGEKTVKGYESQIQKLEKKYDDLSYTSQRNYDDLKRKHDEYVYSSQRSQNDQADKLNVGYQKEIKKLEDMCERYVNTINKQVFAMQEKDFIYTRLKERFEDHKQRETNVKTDTALRHKDELEKVKRDGAKNNIGDFAKALKDIVSGIAGGASLFKMFA